MPNQSEDAVADGPTRLLRAVSAALLLAFAASCASVQEGVEGAPKTTLGGLGGAVAGGLLGAAIGDGRTRDIAAGTAVGALLGVLAGNVLDQRDQRLASQAAARALETAPSGEAVPWTNPDTGNRGSVTPTRTWQTASGQYCREYQQEIVVGGEVRQGFGTACRRPDGTWQIRQ
jgi:surface antigen